jgi:hypothetical protein
MLTEQDLTDLEMADAIGDFGSGSKVSDAVGELRALRATLRSVRDALPMVGADPEVARAVREDIDHALGETS